MHLTLKSKPMILGIIMTISMILMLHSWKNEDPVYKMKPAEFGTTAEFTGDGWNAEEKTVTADYLSYTGVLTEVGPFQLERGNYQFMVSYNTDSSENYCEVVSDVEMDEDGRAGAVYARENLDDKKEGVMLQTALPNDTTGITLKIHYAGGYLKINQIELRNMKHYMDTPIMCGFFYACLIILYLLLQKKQDCFEEQIIFFVLIFGLLYISLPLWNDFLMVGQDTEIHLGRIRGMYYALRDHNFPMWINPFQGKEYGYASSIMYPQLFLWIPAALMWAGMSLMNAYKIFVFIINLFTVVGSYNAFRVIFHNKIVGAVAGLFYCTSLYRLETVYTRGALGEMLAMAFLPILVLGLYQVVFGNYKNWMPLAAGAAGILSSHVLSTYLYGITSLLCVLVMLGWVRRNELKERVISIIKAGGTAIFLNLYFLIPFLSWYGQDFIASTGKNMGYTMRAHGVYFSQMFATFVTDGGMSLPLGTTEGEMPLTIGGISLLILIVSGLLLFNRKCTQISDLSTVEEKKTAKLIWIAAVLSLFMTSNFFPWEIIEKTPVLSRLTSMQFPWRMMALSVMCVTLLLGYCCKLLFSTEIIRKYKIGRYCILIAVSGLIVLSSMYYLDSLRNMKSYSSLTMTDTLGSSDSLYLYQNDSVNVWEEGQIVKSSIPETVIHSYSHKGDTASFSYQLPEGKDQAELTLPLYFYPGYHAYIDGEAVSLKRNAEGRVTLWTETDSGKVTIRFEAPAIWHASYYISAGVIVLCVLEMLYYNHRTQNS